SSRKLTLPSVMRGEWSEFSGVDEPPSSAKNKPIVSSTPSRKQPATAHTAAGKPCRARGNGAGNVTESTARAGCRAAPAGRAVTRLGEGRLTGFGAGPATTVCEEAEALAPARRSSARAKASIELKRWAGFFAIALRHRASISAESCGRKDEGSGSSACSIWP